MVQPSFVVPFPMIVVSVVEFSLSFGELLFFTIGHLTEGGGTLARELELILCLGYSLCEGAGQ